MKTLTHLKSAIRKSGRDISIDEDKPHEMDNCGKITLALESKSEQFCAIDGCIIVGHYFSDIKGSRGEAIDYLIQDIELGFAPMSEAVARDNGIDLGT